MAHNILKQEIPSDTFQENDKPVSVVMISDTHGKHRDLDQVLPYGDILIHAGDFTLFGNKEDAIDFNNWLGYLTHPFKIVINGNHESNPPWKKEASTASILSNAIFLSNSSVKLEITPGSRKIVNVYGTEFYWPMRTPNPYYDQIPSYYSGHDTTNSNIDILVSHGPAKGFVDGGGSGCEMLARLIKRVKPKLFVCGHVHRDHGIINCDETGTTYVNAANAMQHGKKLQWDPIKINL